MAPKDDSGGPTTDLASTLVVVLLSAAIVIFLFWIATQFLGLSTFATLPEFITGPYQALWTSVVAGATGIGLAIVRAFSTRGRPQPNYLKLVGLTSGALLGSTLLLIGIFLAIGPNRTVSLDPPGSVALLGTKQHSSQTFDIEDLPMQGNPISFALLGHFSVRDGKASGAIESGNIVIGADPPKGLRDVIVNRIAFRSCYNQNINGVAQYEMFPDVHKSVGSIAVSFPIAPKAKYVVPKGHFEFDLPQVDVSRQWLCAAVWTDGGGFFPGR